MKKEIKLVVAHNKKLYEISRQCTKITFDDVLNDGSSKLTVSLIGDCSFFDNGDAIQFVYQGVGVFNGFIFEIEQTRGKEVTIVAHDQLRYCKAKDLIAITNKDTVSVLVKRMIRYLQLKKGYVEPIAYPLDFDAKTDSTWLDVIYEKMSDAVYQTKRKYVLRDEFGKLCLRDISKCFMDFIIGDKSLLYDYTYKKSINDDFYNQVKIYGEIEHEKEVKDKKGKKKKIKSKQLEIVMVRDQNSIKRYGTLQYYEKISGKSSQLNKAKMTEKAKVLLADYNRTKHTFNVSCLGVPEVRAGNVIKVITKELAVNQNHLVKAVTHDFLPVHTMSIEFAELYRKESGKSKVKIITKSRLVKGSDNTAVSKMGSSQNIDGKTEKLIEIARSFIGKVRYSKGAESPQRGVSDCSGFTQYCYRQIGVSIGRATGNQVTKGSKVSKSNLRPGDLVFFKNTYTSGYVYGVSHVGIYLGSGKFIHCSSSGGVKISNLNTSYYISHWLMGRRVL